MLVGLQRNIWLATESWATLRLWFDAAGLFQCPLNTLWLLHAFQGEGELEKEDDHMPEPSAADLGGSCVHLFRTGCKEEK